MLVTGLPFTFGRSALAPAKPAPHLGEHTRAVLAEWAGFTDAEITALEAQGVLT
jgi:crotonobetainyl-CoA:carnitine CoA-transferase CaiB-like acyl-CoA transferase